MLTATGVLLAMATALFIAAYRRRDGSHLRGLRLGKGMLFGVAPLILFAFAVAGLIQVVIPPELIRTWLGTEAGWKGVVIGSVAGAMIPGGPYVSFPIIAAIFHAGAGVGTTVSLITGWAMLGIAQMPFELALIGPRFMLVRLCTVVLVPPIAGVLAQYLFAGGF
jgi:uncharacterized membrane protein YraQ (UPF0718 family)